MKKNTIIKRTALMLVTVLTMTMAAAVNVSAKATGLEQAIVNGINASQDEIDISGLNVDPQEAVNTYINLKYKNPELFCVDAKVNCKFSGSTAKSLVLNYTVPKNEIAAQRTAIDAQVDKIVALAAAGKTQEEKAKIVHDYFTANTKYDFSLKSSSVYDLLTGNQGICVSYSHAYKLIMDKLNIPCEMAISTQMQHSWNVVQIDGKWYNVDVTYDVTNGGIGNFLKSDSLFKTTGHTAWVTESGVSCTDTKFDSNF